MVEDTVSVSSTAVGVGGGVGVGVNSTRLMVCDRVSVDMRKEAVEELVNDGVRDRVPVPVNRYREGVEEGVAVRGTTEKVCEVVGLWVQQRDGEVDAVAEREPERVRDPERGSGGDNDRDTDSVGVQRRSADSVGVPDEERVGWPVEVQVADVVRVRSRVVLAEREAGFEAVGVDDAVGEPLWVLESVGVQVRLPVGGADRDTVCEPERLLVSVTRREARRLQVGVPDTVRRRVRTERVRVLRVCEAEVVHVADQVGSRVRLTEGVGEWVALGMPDKDRDTLRVGLRVRSREFVSVQDWVPVGHALGAVNVPVTV
mmetsp:Transcript_77231/g.136167  ORF Transcript_77231/g.136167 Transcript_77231/m.136167 type:complete len:315 (-) Transcript_77231:7-951(-)